MAAHTKIIELFGIPACGKTTLTKYIKEHYSNSYSIADGLDIACEMKQHSYKLVRLSTMGVILRNLRIRLAAPFDNKRKVVSLRYWISSGLLYLFVGKYTKYDLVFFDHGDIQRFVSLERGDDLHLTSRFSKACSQYIKKTDVYAYVYCKINESTAQERIKKRGRSKGRIDLIEDDCLQIREMKDETKRFDYYASLLSSMDKKLITLNTEQETSALAEQLMSLI